MCNTVGMESSAADAAPHPGGHGAIYVDDSGNPGVGSGSDFLPSKRKSWTAVIVPSSVAAQVEDGMGIFLAGVLRDYGADELHFTEIWSAVGPWDGVDPDDRAKVIGIMAGLMEAFSLPVVHQTISDDTLDDHPEFRRSLVGARAGEWRLDRIDHFGLLTLCSMVSRHLIELKAKGPSDFDLPLPLFVDEGVLPAGRDRSLPNWGSAIAGPRACFRQSSDLAGLQLADFAAFTITRSQWEIVKRKPRPAFSPPEVVLLRAASALNILNLPIRRMASEELDRASYELSMEEDRAAKGLPRRPPSKG